MQTGHPPVPFAHQPPGDIDQTLAPRAGAEHYQVPLDSSQRTPLESAGSGRAQAGHGAAELAVAAQPGDAGVRGRVKVAAAELLVPAPGAYAQSVSPPGVVVRRLSWQEEMEVANDQPALEIRARAWAAAGRDPLRGRATPLMTSFGSGRCRTRLCMGSQDAAQSGRLSPTASGAARGAYQAREEAQHARFRGRQWVDIEAEEDARWGSQVMAQIATVAILARGNAAEAAVLDAQAMFAHPGTQWVPAMVPRVLSPTVSLASAPAQLAAPRGRSRSSSASSVPVIRHMTDYDDF